MHRRRPIRALVISTLLAGAASASGSDTSVMHTLAGAFANDGGQVAAAQLFRPFDVAVDGSGNIYVVDHDISQIRVIDTSGVIRVFAGVSTAGTLGDGAQATQAQLHHPFGMCLANGSVYVADSDSNTIRKIDATGIITRVAGTPGGAGNSGDHAAATSAFLNEPWSVAVAADGTMYIADTGNHSIRMVDTGGTITTICGNGSPGAGVANGPAASAQLNSPQRVTLDNANHLLIADVGNGALRQIDLGTMDITLRVSTDVSDVATDGNGNVYFSTGEGIYSLAPDNSTTLLAGDGSYAGNSVDGLATATGIEPTSLFVTPAGTIYFTEETFDRLRVISGGVITTISGGTRGDNGPATSACVVRVIGMKADSSGNIYLPDFHGNCVRKIAPGGTITTFAGTGVQGQASDGTALGSQIGEPADVAVDSHGNVFFSEVKYGDIRKVDTSGNITTFATGIPDCYNLAIDSADNVYALSFTQCTLYKYTPAGAQTLIAGTSPGYFGDGGPATSAQFSLPLGLAVDTAGNIYIGDRGNNRVRMIDTGGNINTIAGTGVPGYNGDGLAATSAKLRDPRSVAVDSAGNVYIGDAQNARIRKVTKSTGQISTIVGTGTPGHTGDGGPGTAATIEYPWGLWVDPTGSRLLLWDWNYFCVREWIANGQVAAGFSNAASMTTARQQHTATLLGSGKVLVAGGDYATSSCLNSSELFDPLSNTWSAGGILVTARSYHTATLLTNGKVLVAAGLTTGDVYLASAELYDPGTNTWSATGSLATPRYLHTATLLPNGKVLVVGGFTTGSIFLNSAELFDPTSKTWSAAGSLGTARALHSAILLSNGKVLVVAGSNGSSDLTSAELYDPSSNTWSAAGNLANARNQNSATLLPSGKVLVAGGYTQGPVYAASAELYDPGTNTWSAGGNLAGARASHAATLLPSGSVLVAGGTTASTPLSSAELYNPSTNTWSSATPLATARNVHTMTLLPNGTVLVAAGYNAGPLASAELYDPATPTWSAAASMTAARVNHTATLLPSGKVLNVGGYNGAELYDPSSNSWSSAGIFPIASQGHTATLVPNGLVLVAGGFPPSQTSYSSAELYNPITNSWSSTSNLATARDSHTATLLPNGLVLIAGGEGPSAGLALTSAELFNPSTNTWSAAAGLSQRRYNHTATLLPNGLVLVAGGYDGAGADGGQGALNSAELYNPSTNTWSAAGSLATARYNHSATLLPNGKVLVAGGVNSLYLSSAELYDPASNTWSPAGSLITARQDKYATLLPNGKVLVEAGYNITNGYLTSAELYDPGANTWSAAGNLSAARQGHTATLLANGMVLVSGGDTGGGPLKNAELYDDGLSYLGNWQPVISTTNSPVNIIGGLVLTGSRFKGVSEASGGSTNNSATNYPIVQLRSLVNDQTEFLLPDPANPWSDTSFTSMALSGFPTGYAEVTVYTNGIPSSSVIVSLVRAQTITFGSLPDKTYGASAFGLTATASSGLAVTYSVTLGPASVAGNILTITGAGDVTVHATQAGNSNFAAATPVDQTFTVNPAALSITANDASKFYNTTNPFFSAAYSGFVNGDTQANLSGTPTLNTTAVTASNVGSYAITVSGLSSANYTTMFHNGTLTINPAAATVALSGLAATYDGASHAAVATTTPSGLSTSITYNGSTTAPTNAGSYAVVATITDPNYSGSGTGTLVISQATPVVTWTDPADIVFGAALGATQLNATANVLGAFAYTPGTGTVLNAGASQSISVLFTPTDAVNYSTAVATVSINVSRATPVITWAKPAAIVAGTALDGTQLNAAANVAGVFTYTPGAGTVLGIGSGQALSVAFAPADSANYTAATAAVTIDVLNATPKFDSQPTAAPNPATSGKAVAFAASATDADGDALTFAWDFGDGGTAGGASVSHTYTAPGTFTAVVTVTDAHGASVNASVAVTVAAATIPIGSGGGGSVTLTDSNGDGIPDAMQASADAKGIGTPAADVALTNVKLAVALNFARPNLDSIRLTGTLKAPAGFKPLDAVVIVDLGGVVRTFKLDKNGRAKTGLDTFSLTLRNGSLTVQFNKGAFASSLSGFGVANANVKNAPVTIPVAIILGGNLYDAAAQGSYTATKGHTGAVKKR